MIESREVREISSGNKRKIESDQTTLEDFYENADLNKERKENIDIALIKAFVCCGLPWRLVEHPFIIELFKQLRSNYNLPDQKTLADTILKKEILRVNVKLFRLLDDGNNLTLGKNLSVIKFLILNFLKIIKFFFFNFNKALDGWTSPSGKSLWNFVIHLGNGRDILWKISDFSSESHTGEFLAQQIQKILEDIGIQKFVGIVTDAGSNVHSARNLISTRFPHVLNIRCIAHSLNLITKDLIKHSFAKKIIQWCTVIVTYFKKSHKSLDLLEAKISEKQIAGGGLKTYLDTR